MSRVDIKAVRSRVKELETIIREGKYNQKEKQREYCRQTRDCGYDQWKYWKKHGEYIDPPCGNPKECVWSEREEATRLYCLLAHLRGRLHMQKISTQEQADLVEGVMDDYLLKETSEEVT